MFTNKSKPLAAGLHSMDFREEIFMYILSVLFKDRGSFLNLEINHLTAS